MQASFFFTRRTLRMAWASLAVLACLSPTASIAGTSEPAASSERSIAVAGVGATVEPVLTQALAPNIYEVVYSRALDAIFVASAGTFGDGKGGVVYQLDGDTLAIQRTIELPLKPFALSLDERAGVLYVGHSLESTVLALDLATGQVRGRVQLIRLNAEGEPIHIRQLLADSGTGTLFVGGVDRTGIIWQLDGDTLAVRKVRQAPDGKSIGLALDSRRGRLYSSGTAAVEVMDAGRLQREAYFRVGKRHQDDERQRYFVNVAVDEASGRVFANESSNSEGIFVFEGETGKLLDIVPTGEGPVGIRLNPVRNEIYVANRGAGTLSIVDASTYRIKHSLPLPVYPNSLAIGADGQVLYVTVKQPFAALGTTAPVEQVVRIDLDGL